MDRNGTEDRAEAGPPCRALVAMPSPEACESPRPFRRVAGGRPMAGFLAQLIVDADPALRPARHERTRAAAALYARTAENPVGRRRA